MDFGELSRAVEPPCAPTQDCAVAKCSIGGRTASTTTRRPRRMFNKVHHIGIAVKDMGAAIALYEKMGAKLLARETSRDGSADLAMLDLGGDLIEPISPLRDDTNLARFIRERGEGLHHVAYDVKNIEGVIAEKIGRGR